MQYHRSFRPVLALAMTAFLFASCEKDQTEANKFPRADTETQDRRLSEIVNVELSNGINLYMQEEHADDQVAIEVFYRAGFIHEGKGLAQVSHVAEHMVVHSATASYEAEEAIEKVTKYGAVAAEAIGDLAHYDYIVPAEKLDEALQVEAERLTSLSVEPELLAREAKRASGEIDKILAADNQSLSRFAMMALNQAIHHGETFVPVYNSAFDLTPADIEGFQKAYYRPDDMVITLVGGFDMTEAEAIVRKHFEGIARRPAPEAPGASMIPPGDIDVKWDIKSDVVYLVYPGPYGELKERLTMTIFGAFLRRVIADSVELRKLATTSYVANPVYPVRELPFFVYAENRENSPVGDLRSELVRITEGAIDLVDERVWPRLLANVKTFIDGTMLKETGPFIPRRNLIGQEALNIGLKHMFREGLSRDEFFAILDSLTYEEAMTTIRKHVTSDNMRRVTISG